MAILLERTLEFIGGNSAEKQADILWDCINNRTNEALTAVQLLYESMYDGITFKWELKYPAAYSLIFWSEAGLNALIEGAYRAPSKSNISIAIELLSELASGNKLSFFGVFDPSLINEVTLHIEHNIVLSELAKLKLSEFIISLPDTQDTTDAIGRSFNQVTIHGQLPARQLFAALAGRWLKIGKTTISEYKDLILSEPTNEPVFQAFLEKYPQLLDPMAMQVWPRPNLHGAKEPDFIIRRIDNTYLVVEIENPSKQIITASNQVSVQVTQAVTQVMQYRSFLMERFQETSVHFPAFQSPECLVVIGLESDLNDEQRKALLMDNQHRQGIRFAGFDWLAHRAEVIANNIIA